jgi:hypothetical protein
VILLAILGEENKQVLHIALLHSKIATPGSRENLTVNNHTRHQSNTTNSAIGNTEEKKAY